MTRIIGVHECELKPGVSAAEFEAAMDTMMKVPLYPGWKICLLKSDRGGRAGKYGLLFEIESTEARDSVVTDAGFTKESEAFDAEHPELVAAWQHVTSLMDQTVWTDYLVIEA
ncbi:MAG TPA: hypothetical protein PKA05_16200 [Roseiflexaceae bacterium]|nr:hypothetical protein [Roseiflexaceae bacterium]HMP41923.1 hypothetical protein [Roseiflexaceae bacterium]